MPTLASYFNDIEDPRTGNAPRHKFSDLMTISLLCALSLTGKPQGANPP